MLSPGATLPIVIEPGVPRLDPLDWARGQHNFIESALRHHGAILFRNFDLRTPCDFEAFAEAMSPGLYGGYGDLPMMEDYALFARMLAGGARPVNVAEPLIYYRVGTEAFKRRGGAGLLRSEVRLQLEFRRLGFTSMAEFARNILMRGGYRLVPWWFRRALYRPIVARRAERLKQDLPGPGSGDDDWPAGQRRESVNS